MGTQITYKGIELIIEGSYNPPEEIDNLYPGAPSDFNINAIFITDIDIYDLFSNSDLEKIGELVIEEIEQ
tara:strand:+ start:339 stop:548 length:210 start_codon:yes stop_codon:yes gene_type:complete